MTSIVENLPYSDEGERIIIACVLMDGVASLNKAMEGKITEDCFHVPQHRKMWRALQWQHKNNKPLELYALAEELKRMNKLEEVGGLAGLVEMSEQALTTAKLGYWIETVRHHYVMREVYLSCVKMKEKIATRSGSVEEFATEVNNLISKHHAGVRQETVAEAADEANALLARIQDGTYSTKDVGIGFPWPDWDKRFGLAKAGELIIIAARPGMGKSSCCRQIIQHWAKDGKVLLFSREMTVKQIAPLFAQSNTGISWREILNQRVSHADMASFADELKNIKGLGVDVYDRDRTLSHIVTRAKAYAQITKPKAIAIDYLQRYDAQQERGETRDMALGRFTMAMKDLAIELEIPIILLAQLGRSVERENREPRMSDLRESGNLEQDADRIIFLNAPDHRPDGTMQQLTDNDMRFIYVDAIQAKGRSDGTGRCGMMFDRPITKFLPYQPT
jgi:replicative DNA helicase